MLEEPFEPTVHIIVPSYNCADAIHRCLDSIKKQHFTDYKVVLIDDASTDTAHIEHLDYWSANEGWMLVRNKKNMKAPYTLKQGIEASGAAEGDIIFLLDGDDFLPPVAIGYIDHVYTRYPALWLTYGSYQPYPDWTTEPHPSEYPTFVRWNRDFRSDVCRFNHPLTFRRFLFDALDDADLQQDDGKWFQEGYDQVIMLPMLEMAGEQHYAFIDEVLYYYNPDNPISDAKLIREHAIVPRAGQVFDRPKKPLLIR